MRQELFKEYSNKYRIALPKPGDEDFEHQTCVWYPLPKDVYDHKRYPKCADCEQRYVPIEKGDKRCLICKSNATRNILDIVHRPCTLAF